MRLKKAEVKKAIETLEALADYLLAGQDEPLSHEDFDHLARASVKLNKSLYPEKFFTSINLKKQ